MSKAILMKVGEVSFLVETDRNIEMPAHIDVVATKKVEGVPEGMQPVVGFASIECEFEEVKRLIVAFCNGLHDVLGKIPRPETLAVEFGIKLAGEGGLPLLTKVSGEANFKVTIQWKKGATNSGPNS